MKVATELEYRIARIFIRNVKLHVQQLRFLRFTRQLARGRPTAEFGPIQVSVHTPCVE